MDIPTHFSRRRVLGAAAFLPFAAKAQDNYPSKPIRMIIPFAAGGATDEGDAADGQGSRRSEGAKLESCHNEVP